MNQLFIPYQIAEMLRNIWFSEPCLGYWQNCELIISPIEPYSLEKYGLGILAPIYQQVLKWLKAEHQILIAELWDGWEIAKHGEDFQYFKTLDEALEKAIGLIS